MVGAHESVIRIAREEQLAEEWALVLASGGFRHRVEIEGGLYHLLVHLEDAGPALFALADYDRENAAPPVAEAPPRDFGPSLAGVVTALAIALSHLYFITRIARDRYLDAGAATAERILAGQWWRTVTALSLHADLGHVLGNAGAALVFVTALGRRIGYGYTAALLLVGGAGGNALNAVLHRSNHSTIGSSTAIFAAVGALGALEFARARLVSQPRRPAWVPLAASVGILGMLGAAKETDLLAHFFGFLVGVTLALAGALVARTLFSRSARTRLGGPAAQGALAVLSVVAVLGCWRLALR